MPSCLQAAQDDARLIVDRDPELESTRGAALGPCSTCSDATTPVRTLRAG
jgi:ATP-dependent DNA helicase RecG